MWDEVESCKKGIKPKNAWQAVIQPTIITRWSKQRAQIYGARSVGRALIIGTPKGYGYLHELFNYREQDSDWNSYHFDYTQSPFLDIKEIEKLKHTLDPIEFASEYLASFAESGNNVFYCFDRKKHVDLNLPYFYPPEDGVKGEDVHIGVDFNVGYVCRLTINLVNSGDNRKVNPEPRRESVRCRDYPAREYTQVSGSARHFLGMQNYH